MPLTRQTTAFLGILGDHPDARGFHGHGARCPWSGKSGAGIDDAPFRHMRCYEERHNTRYKPTVGRVEVHHLDGWTMIAMWDRSLDPRYGGAMAFAAPGDWSGPDLLAEFARLYPVEHRRLVAWWRTEGIAAPDFR